jgi:hypothetical protein
MLERLKRSSRIRSSRLGLLQRLGASSPDRDPSAASDRHVYRSRAWKGDGTALNTDPIGWTPATVAIVVAPRKPPNSITILQGS